MIPVSFEDRIAIQELIANYGYTWDSKDAEGWSNLFIEDGIWELYNNGTLVVRGNTRAALRNMSAENFAGRIADVQTRHHHNSTVVVGLTSDQASAKSLCMVTHQREDEVAPRLVFSVAYEDTFARTASGWRFARRVGHMGVQPRQSQ
jgi:hypothetical protein